MTKRREAGFTLVEMLIALLVFSFIAAASVYALRLGVDSRDQLTAVDADLKRLQISRILIKEDLALVAPRSVRDEFGTGSAITFAGGQITFGGKVEDDEKILMSFVRGGWLNPDAKSPRSALQYVEYVFKNGALIRRARVYLDETERSEVMERVLFDNLDDAESEFLNGEIRGELQWADAWPLAGAGGPPSAVSITLYKTGREPLRQLFWIGEMGAET